MPVKDKASCIARTVVRYGLSLGSLLSISDVQKCLNVLSEDEPDSVWFPETWGMENFAMLSMAASQTRTAKIGSSVINIYSRTPSLVGMGAVTLDVLSKGRLILGLGTSSPSIVRDFHGYEFDDAVRRMSEFVDVVRLVTSGNPINYNGSIYRLKNFKLLIKPYRGSIPIYLAAVNRRMVQIARDVADGVILYLRPLAEMKNTIREIRQGRSVDVACQIITAVSDDAQKAIVRGKKTLAFYIAVGHIYREFLAKNGYRSETQAVVEEYNRSGLAGIHSCITDSMLNQLAACGTPGDVSRQIARFRDAGVRLPIIQFNPVGKDSFKMLHETVSDMK